MASKIAFLRLAVDLEREAKHDVACLLLPQADMPAFFLAATRI